MTDGSTMTRRLQRVASNRWTLQVVVTLVLLGIAVWRVDLEEAIEAFERANYIWAGLALVALTTSRILAAVRWQLYLTGIGKAPLMGLMGAYAIGTLVNTLLPFRAGDFTKIQVVSNRYGLPRAGLASSVFVVEASLDALTLLFLLLLSLTLLDATFIPTLLLWIVVLIAVGGFGVATLVSRFFPREMPRLRLRLPGILPEPWRSRAREAWPRFLDGMVALREAHLLARALSLQVVEWLMRAGVLWLFGLAFALDVSPSAYVVLAVAIAVFTLFPVTFMNLGTYQVVATEVMAAAGVPRGEAFAFSIAAHALSHAWTLVMGFTALWLMRVRPGEALAKERPESA